MVPEEKVLYNIGVHLKSKEDYDRLMDEYSDTSCKIFCGLNFKELFEGYPPKYPTTLLYTIDSNPIYTPWYTMQIDRLLKGGYSIILQLDDKK